MSSPVRRVGSDLSNSIYSAAASHGLQQQSTSSNAHRAANDDDVAKAKQRLSLLFSGVGTLRSVDSGGGAGSVDQSSSSSKWQVKGNGKRVVGGLDIAQLVKKYASMVEHLFASSFSNGRRGGVSRRRELRPRPHLFTSGRRWGAKRHEGRLYSAPASLRGSPVTSGHVSVKVLTSEEESTMEELHSAIQAAIANCKNSVAVANKHQAGGGDHADQCKC